MALSFPYEVIGRTLEAKRRELAAELVRHDGIRVIRVPDRIDDINLAVDREMATADLERKSVLIRQIDDALVRLRTGEYGRCVSCGLAISAARLHSVPWTPRCLRCQEVAEHEYQSAAPTLGHSGLAGGVHAHVITGSFEE